MDSDDDDNTDPESERLLARFADGDESALRDLVDREGGGVLRHIEARMPAHLKKRFGASDIVQQTIIDLVSLQKRFDNRGVPAFRGLLRTMAERNLASAAARERALKRDVIRETTPPPGFTDDSLPPSPIEAVPAEKSTPSKALLRSESVESVQRALLELSEQDREIIRLIDDVEIGYEAAATELGITAEAARRRHSRAIARLRELTRRGR